MRFFKVNKKVSDTLHFLNSRKENKNCNVLIEIQCTLSWGKNKILLALPLYAEQDENTILAGDVDLKFCSVALCARRL